ncbi:MAG: GNAT family N-acetyltransferase, partial [Acidimicrobiales bacterium]
MSHRSSIFEATRCAPCVRTSTPSRSSSKSSTERVEFVVEDVPDPDDLDLIDAEIRAAASAATDLGDQRDLAVLVREDGRLRAGIYGWTWGDCCELQSLWVSPELRGRGLGLRLLTEAEHEAQERGCRQIVIFVHDFQPLALYE